MFLLIKYVRTCPSEQMTVSFIKVSIPFIIDKKVIFKKNIVARNKIHLVGCKVLSHSQWSAYESVMDIYTFVPVKCFSMPRIQLLVLGWGFLNFDSGLLYDHLVLFLFWSRDAPAFLLPAGENIFLSVFQGQMMWLLTPQECTSAWRSQPRTGEWWFPATWPVMNNHPKDSASVKWCVHRASLLGATIGK